MEHSVDIEIDYQTFNENFYSKDSYIIVLNRQNSIYV